MEARLDTAEFIDPDKPMVALTFDDGPSRLYTPEILKTLRDNDAKATFFVLGSQAEVNADVLKQIAESGNEIGNHTYGHLDLTKLTKSELDYQVSTTQTIVKRETGKTPALLRPSYGSVNEAVKEIGMPIILWSIDTLDWKTKNPDAIYNSVFKNVKNGSIILMHDIYKSSADAAARIVPELKRRGYLLLTVSELAKERGIPLKPGIVYGNFYPKPPEK